jgi:hypothetical protein
MIIAKVRRQIIKLLPKDLPKKNATGRVMPKRKLKHILSHSGSGPEKKRAKHPHIQTGIRTRIITVLNIPTIQLDFVFIKTPYSKVVTLNPRSRLRV